MIDLKGIIIATFSIQLKQLPDIHKANGDGYLLKPLTFTAHFLTVRYPDLSWTK